MPPKLLLCDCEGSQRIDRDALTRATGLEAGRVHSHLCTRQIDLAAEAMADPDAEVIVACGQEARTFAALAEELGVSAPLAVDLRDRAGWSDEARAAGPKQAALLADALRPATPAKTLDVSSEGLCLVMGASEIVLPVAADLAETLSVTCLLTDAPDLVPEPERRFDMALGRVRTAAGAFGGFTVTVDGFRALSPGGRGAPAFGAARDGGRSDCDIILDLTGAAPLFPAPEKRDGYLRADPASPRAVAKAASEAAAMVGTFEKLLHVTLEPELCAHARARQTGCTRCLDLCPTGAITSGEEAVTIDAMICAGCGACSAACPSGAVSFDAPPVADVFARLQLLAATCREAGGTSPRLLVHDETHGREMIALSARYGRGLPADVLPLDLPSVAMFGHAEMLAALAVGFVAVDVLLSPRTEREGLTQEVALAGAILGGLGRAAALVRLIEPAEPDALSDLLYTRPAVGPAVEPILPLGRRRDVARLAARALDSGTEAPIPLPAGAPYGAVLVDTEACTLCLSCVGLCPSGALDDNPDRPELRFKEDACLQCGICRTICPENAITLEPRLDISDDALKLRVLHEEEPFACIECGKLFGVKSTIERISAKLEGKHAMFTHSDNARLIRMCDDCRVRAQYHDSSAPFRGGERPRVRTTDDYLKERDGEG